MGKYQKHHPIQFFKDGKKGTNYPVFKTKLGKLGIAICYDMTYEDVTRKIIEKGAQVIIAPTLDVLEWGRLEHIQHALMLPFRAVETGRFIVRPSASGISMVINPEGKILKKLDFAKEGYIDYKITFYDHKTFYVLYGYLLPYLCQFISLLILLGFFLKFKIFRIIQ